MKPRIIFKFLYNFPMNVLYCAKFLGKLVLN
jgi:hypothetical protein